MEKKYIIKFKNQKIDPIKFKITKDETNDYRVFDRITVKKENYSLDTSGTCEEIINWVKKILWKFEIEEITEEK